MSTSPEHLGGFDPEIIHAPEFEARSDEPVVADDLLDESEDDEIAEASGVVLSMETERQTESIALDLSYDQGDAAPLTRYLNSFNRLPSLSAEDRAELGEKRAAGLKAERELETAAQAWMPFPPELAQELERLRHEGQQARQRMMDANQPLVVHIAKRHFARGRDAGLEPFDLIQVGMLGLVKAIDKFDPKRGSFSTVAYDYVTAAIKRAFEDQDLRRASRLPVHKYAEFRAYTSVEKDLTQRLRRHPTEEEIAAELGVETEEVSLLKRDFQSPTSLDAAVGDEENGDMTLSDLIPDDQPLPEEQSVSAARRAKLWEVMRHLPPQQRKVLFLLYAIEYDDPEGSSEPPTTNQVAEHLNITPQAVRALKDRGLQRLEDLMQQEGFGK